MIASRASFAIGLAVVAAVAAGGIAWAACGSDDGPPTTASVTKPATSALSPAASTSASAVVIPTQSSPATASNVVTLTGTMRAGVEHGCPDVFVVDGQQASYVLQPRDRRALPPAGSRLRVTGYPEPGPGPIGYCMQGKPFQVITWQHLT